MELHAPKQPVLLAVSFGTTYPQTRKVTIEAMEQALQGAYPDYQVRRAFTSPTVIRRMMEQEHIPVDNLSQALERLLQEGISQVAIQPTHMIPGFEYDRIVSQCQAYSSRFDRLRLGKPMLAEEADFSCMARLMAQIGASDADETTAVVWVGHGTEHPANAAYGQLQQALWDLGCRNHWIGTVEAEPGLETILAQVKAMAAKSVLLMPLMIVAGDHATHDIDGQEDSWRSRFQAAGLPVRCIRKGLGEYPGVRQLLIRHAAQAMQE